MKPLFSIIIVVYNGASTIRKALESLSAQTFRQFEVVVIDGGSTDNTMQIVETFGDIIGYAVSEPDNGIYDAMNKGIDRAKGQWLYFLGSDDELYSNTVLEYVANEIEKTDCNFFYGNVMIVPQNKKYGRAYNLDRLTRNNISHQAIFYHKRLMQQVGYYNLNHKVYADWEYNLRCFSSPDFKPFYQSFFVANFDSGGVSGGHDPFFLRDVVVLKKAQLLQSNPKQLKHISYYDNWWRMLRNAEIRKLQDVPFELLKPIRTMLRQQQRVPHKWLKNGVFSKTYMVTSYLLYRLRYF